MSHGSTMTIHQGGVCLGHVERVRIHRGGDVVRVAFDLSGDIAIALDDDTPATLRDPEGGVHNIRISRRYYSNGSFRVNGFVEADDTAPPGSPSRTKGT